MTKTNKEAVKMGIKDAHFCFPEGDDPFLHIVKKHADIYRPKGVSLSDAMREGTASWNIEDKVIRAARQRGMKYVVIKVKESGDIYEITIDDILTAKRTYTEKAIYYSVPLNSWEKFLGKIQVITSKR